jgi:hypothetical protein
MPTSELQNQLAKLRRDKKILWLGILFFVLVVLWILVSIFATSRTSTIAPELRELARPFVPRLESRVFEEIMAKRVFDEGELGYFPIYVFDKSLASEPILFDIMDVATLEQAAESPESPEQQTETEVIEDGPTD